jgi:hypothetical protein
VQGTAPLVFGSPLGLELSEPGTGKLSDSFGVNSVTGLPTTAVFEYALFSDDENGNLAGRYSLCPGACSLAVEDGTFQLAIAGEATSAGSFDVRLKSDVDPFSVPEPSSLALLAAAVAGLGLIRRLR